MRSTKNPIVRIERKEFGPPTYGYYEDTYRAKLWKHHSKPHDGGVKDARTWQDVNPVPFSQTPVPFGQNVAGFGQNVAGFAHKPPLFFLSHSGVTSGVYASRVRAQERNCWHPAHVKYFTFWCFTAWNKRSHGLGHLFQAVEQIKGTEFWQKPATFWVKRGGSWMSSRDKLLRHSGVAGVSSFSPARARRRRTATALWAHNLLCASRIEFQDSASPVFSIVGTPRFDYLCTQKA